MAKKNLSAAELYRLGKECETGSKKAASYFKKAAEIGHIEAQFELGKYYDIWRVVRDYNKAIFWYTKAAERGHVESINALMDLYICGGDSVIGFGQRGLLDGDKYDYWAEKRKEITGS